MKRSRPSLFFMVTSWLLLLALIIANHATAAFRRKGHANTRCLLDDARAKSPQNNNIQKVTLKQKHKDKMTLEQLDQITSTHDIDLVLDQVTGTKGGDIFRPIQPNRLWLWTRWRGTVLSEVLPSVLFHMLATTCLCVAIKRKTGGTWAIGLAPDASSHVMIARLEVFSKVWKYIMTITTFTLTFFLGESYKLWKDVYSMGRSIQGRLNDMSLLLATHATRNRRTGGGYTRQANDLLTSVAQKMRAFHILHWASCAREYRVLLTPSGMRRMMERNVITQEQYEALKQLDLSPTQLQTAFLEWIMISVRDGLQDDRIFIGTATGLHALIMDKLCALRGAYGGISSRLAGRMPLAYAHLVQLLVDLFLLFAPFALYAELGDFSILSVGVLTFFYHGLLDLSKVFLDPLDNEDYCQGSVKIQLDVLMREANAASTKWKRAAEIVVP